MFSICGAIMAKQTRLLAITDDLILAFSVVASCTQLLESTAVEQHDISAITQASSLDQLPLASSSMDSVIGLCKSDEFLAAPWLSEIFRVTKPDEEVLVSLTQDVHGFSSEKLVVAGFLEPEAIQLGRQMVFQKCSIKVSLPAGFLAADCRHIDMSQPTGVWLKLYSILCIYVT